MKKQIAMIMAAVLAFSNAGSMMAGELIEVEESIIAEPSADDSLIVEEETALEEYAAEPAPLPDDIVIEEEALEENVIEEAPGELFIEEEITDEPLIEEELTEDYLVAEDTLIDELVEDNNEIFTEDGAVEEVEIPPQDEEVVLEEEGMSDEPALAGAASGQCGDNLSWTLDEEGVLTISGTGEMEDYGTGEWNSQGVYVYKYGPWYDSRDAIKTIIIEEGVTGIGDYAFYECWNLYSVTFPESLSEIGWSAFENCCVLPHIEIPDQVTELGGRAFRNCDNLKIVKLSQGLTEIQENTFSGCANLSDITIPDGVTYLGNRAFYECSELKSVDIPEGVTHIGDRAFLGCKSLTSVTVPESVTTLEELAFQDCDNLVSVSLPSGLAAIEEQLFYGCYNLENLTIPDNVESIGTNSFNHSGITDIIIPESVKSIGRSAFYYSDLKTITFKGDAPTFEPGSFGSVTVTAYYPEEKAGWTEEVRQNYGGTITWIPYSEEIELSTRDVTLVESETETVTVKILNDDAIVSWSSANTEIAAVDANGTITGTGLGKTVITVAFHSGREETVNVTVYGKIELGTKTVKIEETYSEVYFRCIPTETGCYCFSEDYYSPRLGLYDENFHQLSQTINQHKTITYRLEAGTTYYFSIYLYGARTVNLTLETVTGFGQCGDDLSWELKDNTLIISGTGEMWNWDGDEYGKFEYPWFEFQSVIKEVIIEEGVTSIGDHAFSQCDITKVTVPSTVTYIGVSAFSHCYSLSDITIPVSLKRIEDYTFTQCEKLKSINIPPSVTSIGESAFAYSDLHEITIPNSVTSIGNYAFAGCDFTRVTIPNSLENIGEYVFSGCDKLRNVTFPADMTAIEAGMFYECYMLNNVTIPEGVTSIGDRAFASCNALSTISIPGSVTSIGNEAFSWCGKLNSILLSEGLENIGESAFQYTDLENVILPTSLMSIGKNAFWNCHFRSITIPENVVSIGDGAFVYCPLNEIVFNGNAPVFVTDEGADASTCFKDITANAYYFWGKNWPSDVQQNYGGTITWIANNPDIKTESKLWVGKDESESIIATILNDDSIVSYSSGNPEIAEVDDSGIITGIKDGETTITITFQSGYETTVDVSVITGLHPIKLGVTTTANIEEYEGHAYFSYIPAVTDTYYFFSISGTYNTYGKVYDDEFNMLASGYSGEWIDDFKVPYLLEAGKRYYFEAGFYDDIGSFDVRLECTPFFELSTKELKVTENESETISVSILNDDRIASWSSDDPSVAIVDENGTVTGVSVGNTVITLTFESGWQEKINIEVKN